MFAKFDEIPALTFQDSLNLYIKSHLELQREITLIKLAPSPYLPFLLKVFVLHILICLQSLMKFQH